MPRFAGRYDIVRALGRGAMGEVFEARDLGIPGGPSVALKKLTPASGQIASALLAFQREYYHLKELAHPQIVAALEYGVDGDEPYYTMELLGGRNLSAEVQARGRFESPDACQVLTDVASALTLIHARRLVHRDLSGNNVRVLESGRAKLFDFGILCDADAPQRMAGTPRTVAPEVVHAQLVDGRADLYALGVLGYFLLTGHYPYQAKRVADLPALWAQPIPTPQQLVPELPTPLSGLVMDLLRLDPRARPRNAATVVDRLAAVVAPSHEISGRFDLSTLPKPSLVEREAVLAQLNELMLRAGSRSAACMIEGGPGLGKSRILDEAAITARLAGFDAIYLRAKPLSGEPLGTLNELARGLLARSPFAVEVGARHAPDLVGQVLAFRQKYPEIVGRPAAIHPADNQARLLIAYVRWLREVAEQEPLAVLVDDLHLVDETSAAMLATLAALTEPFLVIGTCHSGEPAVAPRQLERIRSAGCITLRSLTEKGIEQMVASLFGDVPHVARLSHSIWKRTAGNPQLCVETAERLVQNRSIRIDAGSWVLPNAPESVIASVPDSFTNSLDQRLAMCTPTAQRIVHVLALSRSALSHHVISRVLATPAQEFFPAISELRAQGLAIDDGYSLQISHHSSSEQVLARALADQNRALHSRLADALIAEGVTEASRQARIGKHLSQSGRNEEAADYLGDAARRLYNTHAFVECLDVVEWSIDAHEEAGRPREAAELRLLAITAGFGSSPQALERHALTAMRVFRETSGMAIAERLHRFLPRRLALGLGVFVRWIAWLLEGRRGSSPLEAMSSMSISSAFLGTLYMGVGAATKLADLLKQLDMFRAFRGTAAYNGYLIPMACYDLCLGRVSSARARLDTAVHLFGGTLTTLTGAKLELATAGVRALRALTRLIQLDSGALEDVDVVEQYDLPYQVLVGRLARAAHHRYRGEERRAREIERAIEPEIQQLGTWALDVQRVLFAHPAYAITGDLEGLKRCVDEFEQLCDRGFDLHARLALCRGEYLMQRGDYAEARAQLGRVEDALPGDERFIRLHCRSARAQLALLCEDYSSAQRLAKPIADADDAPAVPRLRASWILGVSQFRLGDPSGAERLIAALDAATELDSPPFLVQIRDALARIALAQGDLNGYEAHLQAAALQVRGTENPEFAAIVARLRDARIDRRGWSTPPNRIDDEPETSIATS